MANGQTSGVMTAGICKQNQKGLTDAFALTAKDMVGEQWVLQDMVKLFQINTLLRLNLVYDLNLCLQ